MIGFELPLLTIILALWGLTLDLPERARPAHLARTGLPSDQPLDINNGLPGRLGRRFAVF